MTKSWRPWVSKHDAALLADSFGAERPRAALDRRLLRGALACFRPYRRLVALSVVVILLSNAVALVPPLLIRGLIDEAIPAGKQRAADGASDFEAVVPLLPYVLGLILVPLTAGLLGLAQQMLGMRIGQGIMSDLRQRLFAHFQNETLHFFTVTRSGEIVSRTADDVAAIKSTVTDAAEETLAHLVIVIGTLFILLWVSWPLALAACLTVPIFLIPARRAGQKRRDLVAATQEKQAEWQALLQDVLNVGGFVLMRMFGQREREQKRFARVEAELLNLRLRSALAGRALMLVITVLGALGPAVVYLYGGLLVIRGEVSIGTVIAFVAYVANLYRPITRLAGTYTTLAEALGVFQRIFSTLDRRPEIIDAPNAMTLTTCRGRIELDGVHFAYQAGGRPALTDVSLRVEPGQLAALVGPSGAGKTTLTMLVPRFYDPQAGRVCIDGHDLRSLTQASIAAQMALVTQDTYLFHDTIAANLRYARPNATARELENACRAAQIHDFIADLPQGYETIVGERGVKLSGGERQRVAIARALLKNPRILILDEATSALDSTSERLIREALEPLLRGRTTLAIAHRLSTILAADVIFVLDQGRLVEQGTHAELSAQDGLYARLYREQFAVALANDSLSNARA